MPKTYEVNCSIPVHLTIKVDAANEQDAIDKAMEFATLSSYVGNGGSDKLVGTAEACVSIEPGEEVLEGNDWKISVSERSRE